MGICWVRNNDSNATFIIPGCIDSVHQGSEAYVAGKYGVRNVVLRNTAVNRRIVFWRNK